jgi:hypothetical protein
LKPAKKQTSRSNKAGGGNSGGGPGGGITLKSAQARRLGKMLQQYERNVAELRSILDSVGVMQTAGASQ